MENYIVREEQALACTRCKKIFWEKANISIRREHVSTCPRCRRLLSSEEPSLLKLVTLWLENAGRP